MFKDTRIIYPVIAVVLMIGILTLGNYGIISKGWQLVAYVVFGITAYVLGKKNEKKYPNKTNRYVLWGIIVVLILLMLFPVILLFVG
ncbi:hypothetical protein [Companilactobacillus mishanensis]|uniref:hypothetical protein n=1 Tax=Companilactobacillus mishanensis TaxID=2486008 RepID=UPI00129809EB|nr:hypothetical protein [Companilactobacillus mishanensis]MQS89483.1 hypothetical protein [Companilactobacillus mishanensis]